MHVEWPIPPTHGKKETAEIKMCCNEHGILSSLRPAFEKAEKQQVLSHLLKSAIFLRKVLIIMAPALGIEPRT